MVDKITVKKDSSATVTLPLTQAEMKFLFRIRQLKKQEDIKVILVTINPLTISVMGQVEPIESQAGTIS